MSAFSTLLALINAQIKTNGQKAITGAKLNGVLVQMVNELGSGYQFIDIATPATDPGTPDENVWYIASQAGTYTNFGGIIVNENEVCALVWNGSWTKKVTGAATAAQVSQLGQEIGLTLKSEEFSGQDLNILDGINIKSGTSFQYRIVGSWSRVFISYNGVNANRLVDSNDTTIVSGAWYDITAPADITILGGWISDGSAYIEIRKNALLSGEPIKDINDFVGNRVSSRVFYGQQTNLISGLSISEGQKIYYRIVGSWNRVFISYNGVNSNRLVDSNDTTIVSGVWYDITAPADITILGGWTDGSDSIAYIEVVTDIGSYITLRFKDISNINEQIKDINDFVGNRVSSPVFTGQNVNLLSGLSISKGDKIIYRIVGSWSRVFISYNGVNANRLVDSNDTTITSGVWYDIIAPADITILGGWTNDGASAYIEIVKDAGSYIVGMLNTIEDSNILFNKKWVSCGDSFTHGDFTGIPEGTPTTISRGKYAGMPLVYPYIIGNRNNMVIVNEALNGTHMTYVSGRENLSFSYQRYMNIPNDADYITLWFGINDQNQNVPIGEITDNSNTTFYGAWNVVLGYITANYPNAKIGIVITNGCSNTAYPIAIRAIAKKWGISYLDLNGDYKIPLMLRVSEKTDVDASVLSSITQKQSVDYPTNQHPNPNAHIFQSSFIEQWLKTL